jgi:hypothetical protein
MTLAKSNVTRMLFPEPKKVYDVTFKGKPNKEAEKLLQEQTDYFSDLCKKLEFWVDPFGQWFFVDTSKEPGPEGAYSTNMTRTCVCGTLRRIYLEDKGPGGLSGKALVKRIDKFLTEAEVRVNEAACKKGSI